MNAPSLTGRSCLIALLALCAAGPLRAYEISATAQNKNPVAAPPTATMYGQKMILYGAQAIQSQTSANATFNTFPVRSASFAPTATGLSYSGKAITANTNGSVYVRTSGASALVKSWNWLNNTGVAQYTCTAPSGAVSAGNSSSSSRAGDFSAQAFDGSVYWTFFNATQEQMVLQTVKFHFVTDREDVQAQASVHAVFGGAKPTTGGAAPMIFLPPGGGVTYLVHPQGRVLKTSLAVAEGIASPNGQTSSTQFVHQVLFPDCLCAQGRGLRNSKGWHNYVNKYLAAHKAKKPTDTTQNTVAQGSILLGVAQGWLNDLSGQFGLGSMPAATLLGSGYGKGNFGRKGRAELAALMMNRADNRVCLYDRVLMGSQDTTVEAIIAQAARLLISRSSRNQKKGYQLLFSLNNGKCRTIPGAAAAGAGDGPVTIGCGG